MKEFFKVLGIDETRDPDRIKAAYRSKLSAVNPEDDPEGFKRLRSSYENAVRWAQMDEEEQPVKLDESPEGIWLSKVEAVYSCFSERVSVECWTALLEDDVCTGLDTFHSVRDKFLEFLMGHFRLPHEIWKLIDRYFNMIEDKKELYERFPNNFMDYLIGSIDHPWLIDYRLFTGGDDSEYDEYIEMYHKLKSIVDSNTESPGELLQEMREKDVYHPYVDVEDARYRMQQGDLAGGCRLLNALAENYAKDPYILYYVGKGKWEQGDFEGAFQAYQALVEDNPKHFSALLGIGEYYLKKKEYMKAKDIFIDLLELDNQNPLLRDKVKEANDSLIRQYEENVEQGRADGEEKLELGWSYLQNEQYEAVLTLLDGMSPEEQTLFHYSNLKGRTYLCLNRYEEALPYVLQWIKDINALPEGGNEENQKRKNRLGYAYFAATTCYMEMQDGSEEAVRKAEEYAALAIKTEHDRNQKVMYQQTRANFFLKLKQYQRCIDLCDEIVEEYKDYYSAYVTRLEAYFHLEYFQNVIDDYYRAIEIYPYYSRPYLFAAKTFWLFRDYEAGLRVIERAAENKVVSDELKLHESRFVHGKADNDGELEKALKICRELENRESGSDTDLEAAGDVYHQSAICLMDLKRREEALTVINKAIAVDNTEGKYRFVKGNILLAMGKEEEALKVYRQLEKENPDNGVIISRIADTYKKMGNIGEAIRFYEKALAVNPEHRTANFELMRIYKARMKDNEDLDLFEQVIAYASRQLELTATAYYYIERGLVYLDMDYFQEALQDFKKASELEPENMYALNNAGMVFRLQQRYEEAIEYFKQALPFAAENKSLLPYGNMGKCYEALGMQEQALECFQKNLELFPGEPSAYTDLGELLGEMGRFEEAVSCFREGGRQPKSNKKFFTLRVGGIYKYMGEYGIAANQYMQVINEDPSYRYAYKRLARLYIYSQSKYRKAVKTLKQMMKKLPEAEISDFESYALELGVAYTKLKKTKEAKEWLTKSLAIYQQKMTDHNYLAYPGKQLLRLYNVGRVYYWLGDIEAARKYFGMMDDYRMCNDCSSQGCSERLIAKGMLQEADGDIAGAVSSYKQALAISPYDDECLSRIRDLEKNG